MNEAGKEFLNENKDIISYLEDVDYIEDSLIQICAKDKILNCSEELKKYHEFLKQRNGSLYSDIIFNLTGLKFDEKVAVEKWNKLLEHKYLMSMKLNRNVGIKVAALDYFINITGELKNVTILDTLKFQETALKTILDLHTGAYNKDFLYKFLGDVCERGINKNYIFSILFFDIDNFKNFNDNFGHLAGDILLMRLCKILKKGLFNKDLIFRFGGEEFVVFLNKLDSEKAFTKSEFLRKKIAEYNFQDDLKWNEPVHITISGGIATFPQNGKTPQELLDLADGYLFQAKRLGKNKILSEYIIKQN